jgi:hypothetical protein
VEGGISISGRRQISPRDVDGAFESNALKNRPLLIVSYSRLEVFLGGVDGGIMRMKVIVDEFRNALKALRGEITKPLCCFLQLNF